MKEKKDSLADKMTSAKRHTDLGNSRVFHLIKDFVSNHRDKSRNKGKSDL